MILSAWMNIGLTVDDQAFDTALHSCNKASRLALRIEMVPGCTAASAFLVNKSSALEYRSTIVKGEGSTLVKRTINGCIIMKDVSRGQRENHDENTGNDTAAAPFDRA